jgi:bacterioferritin
MATPKAPTNSSKVTPAPSNSQQFVSDLSEIRRRAREHMERGAVTQSNTKNLETTLRLLNEALATEIVCTLRYKRHYYTARGIHKESVAAEFAAHAQEEQEHADLIAERITQLGGSPNFNPEGLAARSSSEYNEPDDLVEMIRENLVAERIAIETYSEMIRFFGEGDPTSRRLIETILAVEEEHANDMADLLEAHHTKG